jgi:hypothetical protein
MSLLFIILQNIPQTIGKLWSEGDPGKTGEAFSARVFASTGENPDRIPWCSLHDADDIGSKIEMDFFE